MKPVLGETFMPLGCVVLEGGGNAELRHTQHEGDGRLELRGAQVCGRIKFVEGSFSSET